ncbi:MAG: hypothetical protein COV91_03600 [Candidatus Taylorbacteria bacterium CG11_big_fil_rev_8_21_14_0_20_46_11]|uniref:Glycosyltransferase 2-like domain-containing protein n=1 Tax=Candidatus Taylorbacteria bacterium CG11_big_fil_rev_8_21_14_0_20_46_11 TaxID=1975025 RepID=A0A2H0KB73_9BACT|nr:MAG: hypothetical protein COV91_03600 [Candidatus Taylorbacteria bacterium CG11_big_fil_rev_8_21_14_0_20_46_11]
MKKPYHIVFTTIFHPAVLEDLYLNIKKYGHLHETKIWVIGDRKTPPSAKELADTISKKGLETTYLSIEEQDVWGKRYASLYRRIPYNNETRRNLGYLSALEDGCDIMISIDDDNFPTNDDFIGGHAQTGQVWNSTTISENTGFHNVCSYLTFKPSRNIFPRGYPFALRSSTKGRVTLKKAKKGACIGVTAGLWLVEPDSDATTWLNGAVRGVRYNGKKTEVLDQKTWTPINTQNTSFTRDLIPAYLCIPMGWPVPGGKIERYGDIWGGYFLQALIQGTKYHVAFGKPLVEHRRNPHIYTDDLRHEFWGMVLTDWLVGILRDSFKPKQRDILGRIQELATFLQKESTTQLPTWCPTEMKKFLIHTGENVGHWGNACKVAINQGQKS